MPAAGEDEKEAARVFYVAATRATQRLVVGVGGDGIFSNSFSFSQSKQRRIYPWK
jgi:ATP-dependent exoDNAse (exonuclease V) beta subunit